MITEREVSLIQSEFDKLADEMFNKTGIKMCLAHEPRVKGDYFTVLVKGSINPNFVSPEELPYVRFANSLGAEFGNGSYIGRVITDYYGQKVRVVGVKPGSPANWVVVRNLKDKKLYNLPFYEALALLAGADMEQD